MIEGPSPVKCRIENMCIPSRFVIHGIRQGVGLQTCFSLHGPDNSAWILKFLSLTLISGQWEEIEKLIQLCISSNIFSYDLSHAFLELDWLRNSYLATLCLKRDVYYVRPELTWEFSRDSSLSDTRAPCGDDCEVMHICTSLSLEIGNFSSHAYFVKKQQPSIPLSLCWQSFDSVLSKCPWLQTVFLKCMNLHSDSSESKKKWK